MTEQGLNVKIQHIEDLVTGTSKQINAVRSELTTVIDKQDRRLAFVEVAVRALEDRELARKVLEAERDRVSIDAVHAGVTRKQLWLAALAVMVSAVAPQIAVVLSHAK